MALSTAAELMLEEGSGVYNQTGRCSPPLSPVIGSFKVVAGDGTSVGTVIRLQCPSRHHAVSGTQMSCVWSSNNTHWSGGLLECKSLSQIQDKGFQLAVLVSFISLTFILFMSFIFITSCLVRHVRHEERRKIERMRKRDAAEFLQQMDSDGLELPREVLPKQKLRNTNNNNNMNTRGGGQHMRTFTTTNTNNKHFTHDDTSCRCHLQENAYSYIQPSPISLKQAPTTYFVLTPQPWEEHCQSLPCNNYLLNPLDRHYSVQVPEGDPL